MLQIEIVRFDDANQEWQVEMRIRHAQEFVALQLVESAHVNLVELIVCLFTMLFDERFLQDEYWPLLQDELACCNHSICEYAETSSVGLAYANRRIEL